jgi:hypothetical protein
MNANWSDYERFLKPIHLKGGERTLTITRISEEDTHPRPGETVKSPVLWFRELPFGLILSSTNRQTLIALYGDEIGQCIGKPITVLAVDVKVGGKPKQPIRIQKKRPNAPHVEPSTGEIVPPLPVGRRDSPHLLVGGEAAGADAVPAVGEVEVTPDQPAETPTSTPAPLSELDAHFGTPKITATAEPKPEMTPIEILPSTEAQFSGWLKHHGWNGKETHNVLGTDAKTWLRQNSGKGWADIAQLVAATLGQQ